ncbi:MAG: hypothetical protein RIB03_01715 [Henriciella sp.]|uniref:hypothetical protein n=1 Tax=Henriciella sp. TaxID=1968823 RepID=UPI00261E1972|nr:hypothetical protein [Henriciella sp.]
MDSEMQLLMARIAHLGEIGEAEARRIVNEVYRDGVVTREEAEALFRLNEQLADRDPVWVERFIEALKDFLLTREAPQGWISDDEASWLMKVIGRDGHVESESEIDLLLELLRYAEGAPEELSRFCLEAISHRIIENGVANEAMSERMRRILSAPGGEAGLWVSRHEAIVLFRTNDAIAEAPNAKSWNNVFAKAILNHLLSAAHPEPDTEADALAREAWLEDNKASVGGFFSKMVNAFTSGSWFDKVSYDAEAAARARYMAKEVATKTGKQIIEEESKWFLRRLGWDKTVSPAERTLIELLKSEAPGFARGLREATQAMDAA